MFRSSGRAARTNHPDRLLGEVPDPRPSSAEHVHGDARCSWFRASRSRSASSINAVSVMPEREASRFASPRSESPSRIVIRTASTHVRESNSIANPRPPRAGRAVAL